MADDFDTTREGQSATPGLPAVGGTMATPEQVLDDTEDVFYDPDAQHVPPLPVCVTGVVHTVPNAAQHTIPYQVTVNSDKGVKIANAHPARRALSITNLGGDAAGVTIQAHQPADTGDGGVILPGAGIIIDDKQEWWALAAADGQKLSVFATFDDG